MKNLKKILLLILPFLFLLLVLTFVYKVFLADDITSQVTKASSTMINADSNKTDCFAHLRKEDKWYDTFYKKIGIGPGECITPSDFISPCELRCAPTTEELKMARIAWKYIENNYNEKTGLINAAHMYPSAATWDWANAVYALYAAKKFCIIDEVEYEEMMNKFLTTMQKMELFNNELPNKTYNTKTAQMVDYRNKVQKDGIGWSAADLARLLSSLNMIEQCEENLAPQIEKLTLRFRYCRALSVEGDLYGGSYEHGKLRITHEALTGYEEYLGRGYELWGHNASEARSYKFMKEVDVYGVKIPIDTRPFFSNFVESEPFWYLGFEYGIDDPETGKYIKNMYQVQEERYKRTGQLTAVTEDNIDRRPYFLFNTVYTNNEPWKTINQMGEDYDEYKTVSTKAGIGMHYLFNTPYSAKVFNYLKNNYDPKKGYYAGIYEKLPGANKAMTLNTNSIILEAMLSSKMGPLQNLHKLEKRGIYDSYRNTVNNFRCLPTDNPMPILEPYKPENVEDNGSDCKCDKESKKAAKIAWSFFENNYHETTGLVNGVNKYKVVRPEHIGKTIMATIAARELDIIYVDNFDTRMTTLLSTLKSMDLYHNELPNLYYDATTGKMVNNAGKPVKTEGGWDLYSIAQMVTGLYHLQANYPKYREDVFNIIAKWDLKRALLENSMEDRWFNGKDKGGAIPIEDPAKEYYIHNAFKLFNIKSYSHFVDERNLDYKAPYSHEVPMGYKERIANGETYLWSMMEHPYYLKYKHYSSNMYLTLKDRLETTEKFATSTEEALDRKPYFISNNIYNNGKLWSDLDKDKQSQKNKKVLSTKAAFIYQALYGYTDDYAGKLMDEVKTLYKEGYGWYGGKYVKSGQTNKSLNIFTNAAVLESLYYRKVGNFYYQYDKDAYEKISLHTLKVKGAYFIETEAIELRYDAQKLMEKFADENEIARVERDADRNFVVRIGNFETEEEAMAYFKSLKVNLHGAKVVKGSIDSKNFMLANRFVKYDYHQPYKNEVLSKENKPYALFLPKYIEKKKKEEALRKKEAEAKAKAAKEKAAKEKAKSKTTTKPEAKKVEKLKEKPKTPVTTATQKEAKKKT
ncbi:DUF3131 domain-containing protein [bacterium]|nr:DUF3131 domain-containing protein [bacterium]MBU1958841.1 DUF3131 domain-containing protein [bacterium]